MGTPLFCNIIIRPPSFCLWKPIRFPRVYTVHITVYVLYIQYIHSFVNGILIFFCLSFFASWNPDTHQILFFATLVGIHPSQLDLIYPPNRENQHFGGYPHHLTRPHIPTKSRKSALWWVSTPPNSTSKQQKTPAIT